MVVGWRPLVFALFAIGLVASAYGKVTLTGINLSAAGFGPGALPGVQGTNFQWPNASDIDYFVKLGMNTYRIPFLWERIQPTKRGALAEDYANNLKETVKYITQTKGKYVVIDVHNYQKYYGELIGGYSVSVADFMDLWTKLYNLLNGYGKKVIWGLMNEPLGSDLEKWRDTVQTVVNGLRALGATQLILIPGQQYTGAGSWAAKNGMVMWEVSDPLNNLAVEIHSYFDENSGGTDAECVSTTIGKERMDYVTKWLRAYNKVGFLGEFGAGRTTRCYTTLTTTLQFLEDNSDVWLGWTYWAGGPWWDDYIYVLQPTDDGKDRPQTQYIKPFLNTAAVPSSINVNKYTPKGDVYLPVYDDVRSNIFVDYSWATNTNYKSTTKVYKGDYSLSFVGKAISWASDDRKPIEIPKFKGFSFWVHPNGANLTTLEIKLTNYHVSPWTSYEPVGNAHEYIVSGPTSAGWYQIFFPFSLFNDGSYSGIMLGSTSGVTTFIDEAYLVHEVLAAVVACMFYFLF